ncbi:MAG: lactate utilization protein [Candidatus Diapherotrites archaeon]|uniref:Lactate utilization protein n=1 Tax=Candidatus Iainarchaeum sp. TaxID=3101447 RepID=A0A8T4KUS2_9ARCH|nr:lactate utilization protein [Candidatus Diapherotrites archaeon]
MASEASIKKTMKALKGRGIDAEFVKTREEALKRLVESIPEGAEIMTGGSTTLEEIGFVDLLKSKRHKWKNLKDELLAEKDSEKQAELRKRSVTSEYFIGSVHAVAETGEVLVASASGSQIPAYSFSSDNIIWIVGAQKIVPTAEDAFRRVREHSLPLEDKRMKSIGYSGSTIGKLLVFEREILPNRKIRLIFVNEKLGF